jgi:enoyl-CoA hydratase/carnithine racemase
MMSDAVLFERDGGVVTLTLNEPETRNAISDRIIEALVGHCARINDDMTISCVILTGAGKSFSAGGNIKDMLEKKGLFAGSPAEIRRGYQHGIQRIPMALYDLEVPIIAAVNGHAVGAGCDLSTMCDVRIAADNAEFAESFLRMGLVSGDGGAWFLSRLIGPSRAAQMTFTGEFIKAEEAVRIGLASRVVPLDDLMTEARALAERIAAQPPHSLRLCKKLLREAPNISLAAHLEMVAGMQALVQHTDDQHEAVKAFFEKRRPHFRGA